MPTIKVDETAASPQDHLPLAERILAGTPRQRFWNAYDSADGKFSAGIWVCEPGTWRVVYTESEFCHLLEGEIVLRGDDGSVATYRAGDSFVAPAGFTGTWETITRTRKLYALYDTTRV